MAIITLSAGTVSPFSSNTPATAPFSAKISFAVPLIIFAPPFLAAFTSASTISAALSETGKTLFPRSVLSGTPSDSKKLITSLGSKPEKAEYKNLPFFGTLAISVSTPQLFVTLQRPFPVIISFRPGRSFFSITVTVAPPSLYLKFALHAAISPAAPPLIITIFFISSPLYI